MIRDNNSRKCEWYQILGLKTVNNFIEGTEVKSWITDSLKNEIGLFF